ncbi:MAG: sugar translocase [Clostridia bacterium]|nr:sugar translocase [Clostridia bacterium]
MNKDSRKLNSFRNAYMGILVHVLIIGLNFITRTVFIRYLNIEYLGVNGLFTNILTVLSLAELGFGSAMTYSMYKPVAGGKQDEVRALAGYFARIYGIVGIAIGAAGLLLVPFLDGLIKNSPGIGNIQLIYVIFLANSSATYFFAHKRAVVTVHQKNHVLSLYHLLFSILKAAGQITILALTQDFILFLLVQSASIILENIFISMKANRMFPYIRNLRGSSLPVARKREIWQNVRSIIIYKIGSTAMNGTDNIIISAFIGVAWVGMLSNYTLIMGSLAMLVYQFTSSISASVGNFIASESKERQEDLIMKITFANFMLYGFSFVCLYALMNHFIMLWIGADYILDRRIVFVIALNWFIEGMMGPVWTFKSTMGLFRRGRLRPAASTVINIGLSIILALKMGVFGVLLATAATRLLTSVWYDPLIVYKHGLGKSPRGFFIELAKYSVVALAFAFGVSALADMVWNNTALSFVIEVVICITVVPFGFFLIYSKTEKFRYLVDAMKEIIQTGGRQGKE